MSGVLQLSGVWITGGPAPAGATILQLSGVWINGGLAPAAAVVLRGGSSRRRDWKSPHVRRDELELQIQREDEEILIIISAIVGTLDP